MLVVHLDRRALQQPQYQDREGGEQQQQQQASAGVEQSGSAAPHQAACSGLRWLDAVAGALLQRQHVREQVLLCVLLTSQGKRVLLAGPPPQSPHRVMTRLPTTLLLPPLSPPALQATPRLCAAGARCRACRPLSSCKRRRCCSGRACRWTRRRAWPRPGTRTRCSSRGPKVRAPCLVHRAGHGRQGRRKVPYRRPLTDAPALMRCALLR